MTQRQVEEQVRARLTEIFASAGVDSSRASLELLHLMPAQFLQAYAELFDRALKLAGGGGRGDAGEVGKKPAGRSGDRGKRPMVGSGGKRYKTWWVVKDDDALQLKHRVDKRLRSLAREIVLDMTTTGGKDGDGSGDDGGVEKTRVRCMRCGRIMARDWNFCAGCGNHRPVGSEGDEKGEI